VLTPNAAIQYQIADARMLVKDDTGEIEISTKDGQRMLLAKNAQGETVFDGPIQTEEQRKALPEDIRKKVEMIQVRTNLAQVEPSQPAAAGEEPDVQ
jgi:hypothetical protein